MCSLLSGRWGNRAFHTHSIFAESSKCWLHSKSLWENYTSFLHCHVPLLRTGFVCVTPISFKENLSHSISFLGVDFLWVFLLLLHHNDHHRLRRFDSWCVRCVSLLLWLTVFAVTRLFSAQIRTWFDVYYIAGGYLWYFSVKTISEKTFYMVLYTLYIMIGLAITSTIIELVRWGGMKWGVWKDLEVIRSDQLGQVSEISIFWFHQIRPSCAIIWRTPYLRSTSSKLRHFAKWPNLPTEPLRMDYVSQQRLNFLSSDGNTRRVGTGFSSYELKSKLSCGLRTHWRKSAKRQVFKKKLFW